MPRPTTPPQPKPEDLVRFCIELEESCPRQCKWCTRCLCSYPGFAKQCAPCRNWINLNRRRMVIAA